MTTSNNLSNEIEQNLQSQPLSKAQLEKILTNSPTPRQLTAQLQLLKKQGKIVFFDGRWALNTCSLCPTCQGKGWV